MKKGKCCKKKGNILHGQTLKNRKVTFLRRYYNKMKMKTASYPRDSCNKNVNLESLYGMCLCLPVWETSSRILIKFLQIQQQYNKLLTIKSYLLKRIFICSQMK